MSNDCVMLILLFGLRSGSRRPALANKVTNGERNAKTDLPKNSFILIQPAQEKIKFLSMKWENEINWFHKRL